MTEDRADRELLFEALAVHLGFLAGNAPGVRGRSSPSRGRFARLGFALAPDSSKTAC